MVDLDSGADSLRPSLTPQARVVEAGVDGAGGAAAMVEIDCAQADHRAEGALPWEGGSCKGSSGLGWNCSPAEPGVS